MKTKTKQTQRQRLLAYLKKHRKGITTMEAFQHLGITCVHKRIAELDQAYIPYVERGEVWQPGKPANVVRITRHREKTASGSIVTRYKLAR